MSKERDEMIAELESKLSDIQRQNELLEKQLKQVERERVEYLQNVSHQLVAPLNAIKWHIENLRASRMDVERATKVLRSIYSQSTIAVHLAKNFALMSNLEADHALAAMTEPLQSMSLCSLLINLSDDFQPLGWDKGLQIGVDTKGFEDAPQVLAIKPLISQVFSNIIENAVKYSDRDTEIRIYGKHEREIDSVSVSIRNRGIPLPDSVDEVFQRGYRSAQAKNQYPAGTGFGLYIAERIVAIHEGEISAERDAMNATVFTVTLTVSGLKGKARIRGPKDRFAN